MLCACGWGSSTWMMITHIHQWNCIHHAKYIYVINFIHEDSFIHSRYNYSLNKFYNVHLFSIWVPLMWSHFIHMHLCRQLHHEQIFIHLVYVNIKIVFLFILVFKSNLFNNPFFLSFHFLFFCFLFALHINLPFCFPPPNPPFSISPCVFPLPVNTKGGAQGPCSNLLIAGPYLV